MAYILQKLISRHNFRNKSSWGGDWFTQESSTGKKTCRIRSRIRMQINRKSRFHDTSSVAEDQKLYNWYWPCPPCRRRDRKSRRGCCWSGWCSPPCCSSRSPPPPPLPAPPPTSPTTLTSCQHPTPTTEEPKKNLCSGTVHISNGSGWTMEPGPEPELFFGDFLRWDLA